MKRADADEYTKSLTQAVTWTDEREVGIPDGGAMYAHPLIFTHKELALGSVDDWLVVVIKAFEDPRLGGIAFYEAGQRPAMSLTEVNVCFPGGTPESAAVYAGAVLWLSFLRRRGNGICPGGAYGPRRGQCPRWYLGQQVLR